MSQRRRPRIRRPPIRGATWAVGAMLPCLPISGASLRAQTTDDTAVHGSVVAAETHAAIAGARVEARASRTTATTDRFGRFTLRVAGLPDTLVIAYIGRHPDTLAVRGATEPVDVALAPAAVALSEVTVRAPAGASLDLSNIGRWDVPLAVVQSVPPAVEADLLRSLSVVPAVSFSSPLSARPLIRGYDADQSSLRIDGFEVLNLYHLGRIFSALPADAAERVSVNAAPYAAETGGALAGVVDIRGKTGAPGAVHGGGNLSLASATAWAGGGGAVRPFVAARGVYLKAADVATNRSLPYDFQDVYLNTAIMSGGRPRVRITAFGTRDHLLDRDAGSGMDWSNLLLGLRARVLERGPLSLDLASSATRFAEDVTDVHARQSSLDLRNRFGRVTTELTGTYEAPHGRLRFGTAGGWRSIANRVQPRRGGDFLATDTMLARAEIGAFGQWTQSLGALTLEGGLRVDASGPATLWQPRARAQLTLGPTLSLGAGAGRTGRLFHIVSDPHAEPDLAFYDFWLPAGGARPVPMVDHLGMDLDWARGSWQARASAFASHGQGLIELRPPTEPPTLSGSNQFRTGAARTRGLEAQIGWRSDGTRPTSVSLSYVLGWSERRWEDGVWRPWTLDRRHALRLLGEAPVSRRWSLFGTVEAMSGAPVTPVSGVLFVSSPDPASGALTPRLPMYLYGPENSARGAGTIRADLGASFHFSGPGDSRMALGVSVINAGFGPVAPLEAEPTPRDGQGVTYKRTYSLPAVPTATLRIEF